METSKTFSNAEKQLELINFLEAFLPSVDSAIPTEINEGGCGIFAKHLYLNLLTLGLENTFEIYYLSDKDMLKDLNYTIQNNKIKNQHVGIQHCFVKINDFIFVDSKGVEVSPVLVTKGSKEMFTGTISIEALQTLIDNDGSWNDVFDRDCEEQIKTELGKMKEKFENFLTNGTLDVEMQHDIRLTKKTVKAKKAMMCGGLAGLFGRM